MEQELQPYLENGYLSQQGRKRYLADKGYIKLDKNGRMCSVCVMKDDSIPYTQANKDIDEWLKGKKQKKNATLELNTDSINKRIEETNYEKDITADEIPF